MTEVLIRKKAAYVALWSIAAFLLLMSRLPDIVHFVLPFRKIYVPVAYWVWIFIGAGFVFAKLFEESARESIRKAIPVFLVFQIIFLFSQLLLNGQIYDKLSKVYLVYIAAAEGAIIFASIMWAMHPIFEGAAGWVNRFVVRLPLIIGPALSLLYLFFHSCKIGIVLFAISMVAAAFVSVVFIRNARLFQVCYATALRGVDFLRRHYGVVLALIFILAFLVRMFFSVNLILKTGNEYLIAGDDSNEYHIAAVEVAKDPSDIIAILAKRPWPPVYMAFLSLVYTVFGVNFYAATAVQSAIGGLMALLICFITARLFNRRTAVIAGILVALSQPIIFNSSVLGTEAIYIPLIAFALLMLLRGLYWDEKFNYLKVTLAGLALGIAAMTLGSITLFPLGIFVFILLARNKKVTIKKQVILACVFLIAFLGTFFLIRNIFYRGVPFGKTCYEERGFDPWEEPTSKDYKTIDPDNREFIALGISPFRKPAESLKIITERWREVLAIAFRVYPVKLRGYYFHGNFGFFDPVFFVNVCRFSNKYGTMLEFYTIVAFFIGFIAAFRTNNRLPLYILLLYILYYTFMHGIIFHVHNVRYHCPLKPFLIIFLAYGIHICLNYFEGKKITT